MVYLPLSIISFCHPTTERKTTYLLVIYSLASGLREDKRGYFVFKLVHTIILPSFILQMVFITAIIDHHIIWFILKQLYHLFNTPIGTSLVITQSHFGFHRHLMKLSSTQFQFSTHLVLPQFTLQCPYISRRNVREKKSSLSTSRLAGKIEDETTLLIIIIEVTFRNQEFTRERNQAIKDVVFGST